MIDSEKEKTAKEDKEDLIFLKDILFVINKKRVSIFLNFTFYLYL